MIKLEMANDKKAYFDGKTFDFRLLIKSIAGSAWDKKAKRWEIPLESMEDAVRLIPSVEISDDVKKAYQTLNERLRKTVQIKDTDESKVSTEVKGLKGKLYPYQAVGKEFLMTLAQGEGAVLAFDMGLGKSLTALATFIELRNRKIVDKLLVVCPSPLKYSTWEKEVRKWTSLEYVVVDGDKREQVEWEDGTKEKLTGRRLREVQYQQHEYGVPVTIVNYELFLRDAGSKAPAKTSEADLDKYRDIMPDIDERWMVVLDEAHRIKNPKAQTTKNLIRKLAKAGRKVLGTGTPLENSVQELWSLINFCREGLLGNYYKFLDRYVDVDYFGNPTAPKPHMMAELKKRIDPIMLRKSKAEALPDLPPLTVQEYWVDMTKTQKDLYKQAKDGIIQNLETKEFSYLEVLAQITRLQQICDSPALMREVFGNKELPEESGKLNELGNIIRDINPQTNKFILFSQYAEMTDILYNWMITENVLPKHQIGYVKGGNKPSETARVQDRFQNGDIQCIIMTTAGNYGLDLSAGSYVICYDQLFNPQKMEQIYARAHRNGVKSAVTAINLITRDSYEERKLSILESKRELFDAFVDEDTKVFEKLFGSVERIRDLL